MKPRAFIFIGRSGCGKGTQAKLLIQELSRREPDRPVIYVETGDRFRKFISGHSFTSMASRDAYLRADRQPDFLAVEMWATELIDRMARGDEHLVFDGTPRSVPEAEILTTALKFYGRENADIIYLDVSREFSEARLKERGRSDDRKAADVKKRLDWFDSDVLPAIDYFGAHQFYHFHRIKGEQSIPDVERDVKKEIFHESH